MRKNTIHPISLHRLQYGSDSYRQKAEGAYAIKVVLEMAKNGTVRTVVAESAPTPEVKSRIEQQARDWIFEPYLKDGVGVNVKLSTTVHLNVIRSR